MSKLLFLWLFLTTFISFSKLQSQQNEYEIQKHRIELSEKLDGLWLNKIYLDSIRTNKSPYSYFRYNDLNNDLSWGYFTWFGFSFNMDGLLTEQPYLYGFFIHEGGYGINLLYDNKYNAFITTNINTLSSFQTSEVEPNVKLNLVNDTLIEFDFSTGKEYYINSHPSKSPHGKDYIDEVLNKLVIKGEYKDLISGNYFYFSETGYVAGFNNILKYKIFYDFVDSPQLGFDILKFSTFRNEIVNWGYDVRTGKKYDYKFVFKQDTLYLYPLKGDIFEYPVKIEVLPLKYKLIKIN